ncbi:hypothetical protein LJR045_002193 [Microbacterium sp. LjRoot45]
MLDLLFVAGILFLFLVVGLVATALERLGPPASGAAALPARAKEERR